MEDTMTKTAKLVEKPDDTSRYNIAAEKNQDSSFVGQRRYFLKTFGCQMNEHDSEKLGAALLSDGMLPTDDIDQADVVILNTCCIRENADNKLYGHLGNLREKGLANPDFQVVVAGCLAQRDKEELLKRAPYVDVVLGTNNTSRIAELLKQARETETSVVEVLDYDQADDDDKAFLTTTQELWMKSKEKSEKRDEEISDPLASKMDFPTTDYLKKKHSAFLTIQAGCDNSCAFCIVPSVRGPEVSVPFGKLTEEARRLADFGVTEITLLGQNVNSYGRDTTVALRRINGVSHFPEMLRTAPEIDQMANDRDTRSFNSLDKSTNSTDYEIYMAGMNWVSASRRPRPLFADLLRAIGEIEQIKRIRFTSPHPKDLRPETIEAMAETPSVCEQLHLPLQSGSDSVLKAMRRGYSAKTYLERLQRARLAIDDLAVTTDLIVGFPGESEEDFLQTLELVAEVGFDSAYTFIFSPRKGTRAAQMEGQFIDEDVIADRFSRLSAVIERSALEKNLSRVGKIEEVLTEGISKKDDSYFTGRTRQGKLVHFRPGQTSESTANNSTAAKDLQLSVGDYLSVKITKAAPHHLFGEPI